MTNTSTAVVAQGPSGALIQLDQEQDREKRDAARNLTDYLTRIWAKDLRLSGVESIDVNGLDAVTGRTKIKGKNGMVDVRLVAIDFEDDMIFRFTMLTPPELTKRLDPEMRKTARSFHRLGRNEASEVKPLRLEIAPVRRGDTEQRFSAMMALPDDDASQALEKFRVLNGLRNDESIEPGQRVKIVRDDGAGRGNDYDSDDYRSWR
jgi:predicted Zn-dependent protease